MKKHVIKICQTAYFELKRISSIRRFLTEDAAKTLVTSYILSRLDHCNCLLMGTPNSDIQPLQKIQNFAPRHVLLATRHHQSTPLLERLHWLPISERIKVACVCFSAINGSGPAYVSYTTLFFFFFFFFVAVPSTVPTSEALLPRRSSRHPSPPATPRAHSASRPRPQRSTGSDVRSLVGCHPKETLHCC